ncbi:MAG: 5'/3'-nucleotidase SurE [Erysipelotrichaceae bacterium]|nr:5'/3'-nucleotidase SurE [Erysipelotrichaceae bacterium]
MDRKKVLITNDDGIGSRGLQALVEEFSQYMDVYVVAPEGERSSNSHHMTLRGKVRIEEREMEGTVKAYALWGTPADCVHLSLRFLFKDQIDLVVSGINRGLNVSSDLIYSGTAAAAREALIQGVPSIAVSLQLSMDNDYRTAAGYARILGMKYLENKKKDYYLNINVPDLKGEEIKGVLVCDRLTRMAYSENISMASEDGIEYIYIISSHMKPSENIEDLRIDRNAVVAGYVAVSPLGNLHVLDDCIEDLENVLK